MLTNSTTRYESQNTMMALHNLVTKYEHLEQNYNILKLENEQYKQLIGELEIQNRDLRDQVECFENTLASENHLKPMLKLHIASIQTELENHNQENITLTNDMKQQSEIILTLKKKNGELIQQNNEYRMKLETNNKHTKLFENKKKQQIQQNETKITLLQNEIDILRDELNIIKQKQSDPQQNISINLPDITAIKSLVSIDGIYNRTMSSQHYHNLHSNYNSPFGKDSAYIIDDINEFDNIINGPGNEIDNLNIELNELKNENIELKSRLNKLKSEEKCVCGGYKFIDDSDSDDEFEEDEINEMERLYEKCEGEIISGSNNETSRGGCDSNLIDKYKWLFFEFQLRKTNFFNTSNVKGIKK